MYKHIFQNHKEYRSVFIFFAMNLCFYGNFMIKHYAPDTYLTEVLGWEVTAEQYWQNGRWLMTALSEFCNLFQIDHTLEQLISWGIGVISVSVASAVLYGILKETLQPLSNSKKVWMILISFMMISNVFLVEDFIFAEYTGMICLGILFDVLGAWAILRCIKEKKLIFYILGIAFGILGINGHQGNFAILVVIAVLCAEGTFQSLKQFLLNNVMIGSAYLIPALVNVLETRIGGASRAAQGGIDILAAFEEATEGIKDLLLTTASYMPYRFYVLMITILGGYFLVAAIHKKKIQVLGYAIYYLLILAMGIYAPLMATDVEFIDVVPRTVYIMGGIIPVILMLMVRYLDISLEKRVFLPLLVGVFLFVQYRGVLNITADHYKANLLDRYEAQFVGEKIYFYEEETGIQVTKMALYWDDNVTGLAPDISGYGAVNERIMSNDWAAPLAIACLDGHVMQQTEPSQEVYEKYFQGKDWLHMEEAQMVIIGDTLHLCAY